jgi:cytochrome oxidase assembly protein ShyY1
MCNQDEKKQGDRKANPECQRLDGAIAFSLVAHEEDQGGSKTADDENKSNGNDDFHVEGAFLPGQVRNGQALECIMQSDIVMPIKFRFGWIPLLATVVVMAIGISLGNWQTRRAAEKEAIEAKLTEREAASPLSLKADAQPLEEIEYRQAVVRGEFVSSWPIYLDNRPYQGRAGFYVLMPLKIEGADKHVLIARGWVARDIADRTRMPTMSTPSGIIEIRGIVRRNAGKVLQLGSAEPVHPGAILQNLDIPELVRVSGLAFHPFLVEQLNDTQDKLVREWPRPSTGSDKHRGYAFQWYALAATAFVFFVVTGFRRGRH